MLVLSKTIYIQPRLCTGNQKQHGRPQEMCDSECRPSGFAYKEYTANRLPTAGLAGTGCKDESGRLRLPIGWRLKDRRSSRDSLSECPDSGGRREPTAAQLWRPTGTGSFNSNPSLRKSAWLLRGKLLSNRYRTDHGRRRSCVPDVIHVPSQVITMEERHDAVYSRYR